METLKPGYGGWKILDDVVKWHEAHCGCRWSWPPRKCPFSLKLRMQRKCMPIYVKRVGNAS